LRFDFFGDRGDRITDFRDDPVQIVARNAKPLLRIRIWLASATSILLRVANGLVWRMSCTSVDTV
jgi:hypothetical protein